MVSQIPILAICMMQLFILLISLKNKNYKLINKIIIINNLFIKLINSLINCFQILPKVVIRFHFELYNYNIVIQFRLYTINNRYICTYIY